MEIKKEILEEINNNYIQGIENKTVRCALVNNKIRNIMRNKEKEGKLLFNFSLNLDTLRVVDQKNSGNSFIYAGCNVLRESICKKYNLEDTWFALEDRYEDEDIVKSLMDGITNIFMFDLLIGESDRTLRNIEIIESDNNVVLAPL